MRKNYRYVPQCANCRFKYDCCSSPYHKKNFNNSIGPQFVFFPELLNEASFPALFPELSFYP